MVSRSSTSCHKRPSGALVPVLLVACAALAIGITIERGDAMNVDHSRHVSPAAKEYEGMALILRVWFKPLPIQMPGSGGDTPELIALGRRLYFERGISLNKSQSCGDCHRLDQRFSGADGHRTSKGAKGLTGKRNSPTVLNAGFQAVQFWDGRAADLVEQAKGPLLNPVEMSMRTPEDVVIRLRSEEDYPRLFKLAFPSQQDPVTFDNAARAIAAFERTLVTPARFDRYLRGERKAITRAEEHGLHRFVHTGCVNCHNSTPMGGRTLQELGLYHRYRNRTDLGRYEVTKRLEDKYIFKVPMLRNVARTAPYFHDGQVATLPEAVRQMAWMQLGKKLSSREINEIVGFLRTLDAEHPIVVKAPQRSPSSDPAL